MTGNDKKDFYALVDKVRSKFKVCVKPSVEFQKEGEPSLVIASLNSSEAELHKELDHIADFCEDSGFGRIAAEVSFVDHVDMIAESD